MVNKNEQFLTGQSFQLTPTDYETDESEGVDESLPIGEQIQTLINQKQDPQNMSRAERRRFEYNNKKREREKSTQDRRKYRNYGRPKPDAVYEKILEKPYNPRGMSAPDLNLYREARQWYYDNNPDVVPGQYGEDAIGPLTLLGAEQELTAVAYHSIIESLPETTALSTNRQQNKMSGPQIPNLLHLFKFGAERLMSPPSEETRAIVKQINPFDDEPRTMPIADIIRGLDEETQKRPLSEQIIGGTIVPTNVLPVGWLGGLVKTGGKVTKAGEAAFTTIQLAPELKATSNHNTFKTFVQSVPDALGKQGDDALIEASKKGKDELVSAIMNTPIDIEGLPAGTLFEGDVRIWLMMGDKPISLKAFGEETGVVLQQGGVQDSLERLVELGLLNKRTTKLGAGDEIYEKTVDLNSPEAIEVLRSTGMKVGVGGAASGNKVVFGLKSLSNQIDDINVYDSNIARKVASGTGINPSAAATTPEAKAKIAVARQQTSAKELVEVTLQGRLDSLAGRSRGLTHRLGKTIGGLFRGGGLPIKIDKDGVVDGTEMLWQDLFSIPEEVLIREYGAVISDDGLEYIRRYREIVDEVENLRVENGLPPLSKDRDGYYYIPRQVVSIDDVQLLGKSNSHNARTWETAMEARVAGKVDEVTGEIVEYVYEADPRATLASHMRAAYGEIIDDQLTDYLAKNVKSFTPTEYLEKLNPQLISRTQDAINTAARDKAALKRARRKLAGAKSQADFDFVDFVKDGVSKTRVGAVKLTKEQSAMLKNINKLQDDVDTAAAKFAKSKATQNQLKKERSIQLEKIRKSETLAGKFFGDVGEISVRQWRGKIYNDKVFRGIEDITGVSGAGPMRSGTKGISQKVGGKLAWGVGRVTDAARFLMATADFGAPFIQGLPILATNPKRWAAGTLRHYGAFLDPSVQARYVENNYDTFIEMAQNGIPVGDSEMFAALQKGRGIPVTGFLDLLPTAKGDQFFGHVFESAADSKVYSVGRKASEFRRKRVKPFTNQTMGRFQSSYSMFLAYNRAELFKTLKPTWTAAGKKGNSVAELATYINNLTGGLDVKGLGVSSSLREIESTWLAFSPRLLRSTTSLVADAIMAIPATATGKATARQKASFRAVAQTIAVTHGMAASAIFAHGLAKGDSMDKIIDDIAVSQNPLSGKRYLSIEIDGEHYGVGGQIRALTQLLTGLAGSVTDPTTLASMDLQENPFLKFMASRGSQGVRITQTVAEGITPMDANPYVEIEGLGDMAHHLLLDSAPFVLQGIFEGSSTPGNIMAMTGMRTSPSTASDDFKRVLEDDFRKMSEEELAKYGHKPGSFPKRSKDMNSQLYSKLVQENEELQELREDVQEERQERGSDLGKYIEAKNEVKNTRDTNIANALEEVGVGKKLREAISRSYGEYIDEVDKIESDSEYEDLKGFFDEQEESENEFNRAVEKYFAILEDPPLEDLVWGYDFKERDKRIENMRQDPEMADHVDNILEFVKSGGPPIVQKLNQDRQVMEPYFRILDEIVEEQGFAEKYDFWKKKNGDDRQTMREGGVPSKGWSNTDSVDLRRILAKADEKKLEMRKADPVLDGLLWKWEYNPTPANLKVKLLKKEIQYSSGGLIGTNRGEIDNLLRRDGFNW